MADSFLVQRRGCPPPTSRCAAYRARPAYGGFAFTINDGRAPGRVHTLTTAEFWSIFERFAE